MSETSEETSAETLRDRLRGKVAAILNKRELVVNLGRDDGVEEGMRFVILNSKGVDVKDPDTGEVLGSVEVPKTMVKVVRVDSPHLAVARTFRLIPGRPSVNSILAGIDMFAGRPDRTETLAVGPGTELRSELPDSESYVKVGDVALETWGDEYDEQVLGGPMGR